ncbi:MAG: HDOD domain-containing protein, partial [Treponema sp.]|nr:HDOD domain-containing protein [Treponema sp.]
KIMQNFSGSSKGIWEHSQQVAFYSYNMARNFCAHDRSVLDDAYICGLLHDIGRVVFETTHPDILKKIAQISGNTGKEREVFEKLIAGVNHGEVGAKIAEQWNFPENIIHVIRYHHSPEVAPKQVQKLTAIVYLADLLSHYQDKTIDFYQIDSSMLSMFGINSEAQFKTISDKLEKAFTSNFGTK